MQYATRCLCGRPYSTSESGKVARQVVTNPREAFQLVKRKLWRSPVERLLGIYLDAQNGVISVETLSQGTLNTTRTHPREILRPAIVGHALGFILAHNHPSGSLVPSSDDVEFTRAVRRAGDVVGIDLYDHVVVGRERGFISLKEQGKI